MPRSQRLVPAVHTAPNLTPLVDVVLCVLIFMMLVGSLQMGKHYLSTNVPDFGGRPSEATPTTEPLMIYVTRTAGGFSAMVGGASIRSSEQLTAKLSTLQHSLGSQTQVIIQPDANVTYPSMLSVYEASMSAGFERISLAQATRKKSS